MQEGTTEFSFILKPSEFGIGVFMVHDIKKDAHLRLFGDQETIDIRTLTRKKSDVPVQFQEYCMNRGEELICPIDFGHMHPGWYLNHSLSPNAYPDNDYKWYALRDIRAGEEITIDYNSLGESEDAKERYYK